MSKYRGLHKLDDLIFTINKPVIGKKGVHYQKLLKDWRLIVGDDIADRSGVALPEDDGASWSEVPVPARRGKKKGGVDSQAAGSGQNYSQGMAASVSDHDGPLHFQRLAEVVNILREYKAGRVVDLGCGEGKLLVGLRDAKGFSEVAAVDVDLAAVEAAWQVQGAVG